MIHMDILDKFEQDFDSVSTLSAKESILESLLNSDLDFSDDEVRLRIREYKAQISDFRELLETEQDSLINREIESRKYTLYTCMKSVDEYVSGRDYYVFIDDVATQYRSLEVDQISQEMADYVNKIKPIVWIISDNGIGTLKRKNVFSGNFSKFFTETVFS